MNQSLRPVSRIACIVSALALAAVIFLPIWRIDLTAPQYPEGLYMQIYADKLGGDIDVINGLNHYIGMKHINEKDFIEFKVLPLIIGCLALFGLLTAIINRKWFLYVWAAFFLLFGIVAIMDFYQWLYNYGHNLDPTAPIRVPGMAYQPPLIGFKQLLNFGAYSMPDAGGWIFIATALILAVIVVMEFRSARKVVVSQPSAKSAKILVATMLLSFSITSCGGDPVSIPYGNVACENCNMTLLDKRFGTAMVNAKGKVFYFDDLACTLSYLSRNKDTKTDAVRIFVSDYLDGSQLVEVSTASFARGDSIRGPMGGNIAAFRDPAARDKFVKERQAGPIAWEQIQQQ